MADQDWHVVTLNKRPKKPKTQQEKNQQLKEAQRSGQVVTVNKGVSNKQHQGPDNYGKIAQAEEAGKVVTVSIDISRAIQQARQQKNWTQKELATKINEQQRVIADYESGRAVPNNQVLGKLERVLGVKLRGK
jgi:putative transcription factor